MMKKEKKEMVEGRGGGGGVEENSTRRSSAAITGCQLAKKSNARLPSLCDAMLMACRCLFSTRCLHTWLDPRGISEMFLAPIRNHIPLLSSLSLPSPALSVALSPFLPSSLARVAFVVPDQSPLTPTTPRPAFSALFREPLVARADKFVSVSFICPAGARQSNLSLSARPDSRKPSPKR